MFKVGLTKFTESLALCHNMQPGTGYTLSASSHGTTLNIQQPWSEIDNSGGGGDTTIQQFQMRVLSIGINNVLQIAKGTSSFTQSNMPRVRQGGHYDQRQTWISKIAVYGSGISLSSGPGDTVWMDGGGYYNITSPGTYYVTISKFDVTSIFDDTDSVLLNAEAPWISIFKAEDPIYPKIFAQTGASEYVNKTNVQKMVGYDAMSTGLAGDWGNCHTTWFNPVKWGYSVKLIGIVTSTSGAGEAISLSVDQHIVGPIDLQIPCLFNGTTLCNQDNLTETNDPYNTNKNSVPRWPNIANAAQFTAIQTLTAANDNWYEEFVGPADWTEVNYSYLVPESCAAQDDDECQPFKVKNLKYVTPEGGSPYAVYSICPGLINNLVPLVYDDISESWVEMNTEIEISLAGGNPTWVVLRSGPNTVTKVFPSPTSESPEEDNPYPKIYTLNSEPPNDTNELAYVILAKITAQAGDTFDVNQYVTGSLWGDRIQIGAGETQKSYYYYARV